MRECTEAFCPIDHIAIDVADIAKYTRFFETVFGMKVWRVKGPAESPESVWLDGGIQLPGEPEDRKTEAARKNGISLSGNIQESLYKCNLSKHCFLDSLPC